MQALKPMTHEVRKRIQDYIKNGLDVSDLIKDYSLKGENLSRAIIKTLVRYDEDMSGCQLTYATLGDESKPDNIVQMLRCNLTGCNFEGIRFISKTWVRSCVCKNMNLKNADLSKVDYKYTDFRGCKFCSTILRISTGAGIGCKFSKELFTELTKGWGVEIDVKEKSNGTS